MATIQEQIIVAASYERVSTAIQGRQGFSLAAQHKNSEEFAESQGWLLPAHLRFRDGENENASGASWDLPGLNAMLASARDGAFSVLIVPDLDRFARSLVKGLVLEEQLRKHGVRVVYQRVPVEDTPEGRLLKNQLFSFAEFGREKFILRSLTGRQQKARSGKVVGQSVAPYGYRYTYEHLPNGKQRVCGLEPDPATAPIVTQAIRDLVNHSCSEVAARLNAEGIPTARGTTWKERQVWRLAISPVYVGSYIFGGANYDNRLTPEARQGIVVNVPPLIDRATWEQVQASLERRKSARRGRKPSESDPYLLRSMLMCGHCGGPLHTDQSHHERYYMCGRANKYKARVNHTHLCNLPGVRSDAVEAELWRVISDTLLDAECLEQGLNAARDRRDSVDNLRTARSAAIDSEIGRQRHRLDTLAARFADAGDGEVFNALMRQAKEIEAVLERLQRERIDLMAVRAEGLSEVEVQSIQRFAAEIVTGLERATTSERRRIFEMLQIRGTVHNDPHGVKLTRRTRFRIEWQAAIPLLNSMTVPTSAVILFRSGGNERIGLEVMMRLETAD